MNTAKYGVLLLFVTLMLVSCRSKEASQHSESEAESNAGNIVEVQAVYDADNNRHLFQTDADTIPSGWTTFRFTNQSPMVHFMVLEHMPEGKTSEDSERELIPPFQEAMDLIMEGKSEQGMAKLGELPAWFSEVTYMGGVGLVSPGHAGETTVKLTPGNYVIECYVKTEDGKFHSSMGMFRDLVVTGDSTEAGPPANPDIQIALSNDGFDVEGETLPGEHLVAVTFNAVDPPLLGNDVHLARLSDLNIAVDSVAQWMDWSRPMGLVSTVQHQAPATFLGGTHEMPRGNTAYFRIDLEPGRYAWISERPADNPLYKEFSVIDPTL